MNVWVALAHARHPHHAAARGWIDPLGPEFKLYFCRMTQLGLLRLLTTGSAMGEDVMTQSAAWKTYDRFFADGRNRYANESAQFEKAFRRKTSRQQVSPKQWADGYVAAFAESAGLRVVTFDRALASTVGGSILIRA